MAENRTTKFTDIAQEIKQFPGPYVGYVKNPTDVNRMGRLFVHIPELHGEYDEINKSQSQQTVPCQYCSPFAGQTPLANTADDPREFANTQKSYGFWMVPPDIDTKVLVMFANGNPNQAYWIGCVFEDYMNNMTPGISSSSNFVGNESENARYFDELSLENVPVAEAQRKAESLEVARINTKVRDDVAFRVRPVHTPQTETLIAQGLINDGIRGTTSSSARRETPSQVFGISTPGPIDFNGQKTSKKESINRHGKIYNDSGDEFDFGKVAHSRLGGNTFVMDDGVPRFREGNQDVTQIENELIRLRTRSGTQLLLHNTEGLAYLINNDGTAWIEFSKDGKIDIYSKDSVSVHTENDFNLRAERDVNIEAGRNVNIKATGQNAGDNLINSDEDTTTGRVHINASGNLEMYAGNDINQKAVNDYKLFAMNNGKIEALVDVAIYADNDFLVNVGAGELHLNTDGKVEKTHVSAATVQDLTTFNNVGVNQTTSILKRVPTAEPYAEHENIRRNFTRPVDTDREKPDDRFSA
jgi:hypothetical protein